MESLRGLNEMMCVSCLATGLVSLCSQNSGRHSSIQTGPLESVVWKRQTAGSKRGLERCAGEVGAPRKKSWAPFALRDLSPPEPLSVPDPGLPELPYLTPSYGGGRISGPCHSSHPAKGQGDNPRLQEQISDPSPDHCVVLASVLELQFLPRSNGVNAICLIQTGMKSDEVREVKCVGTGKGFGSVS